MERADPAVVVPVLNDYLDATCAIALQHGGGHAPNSIAPYPTRDHAPVSARSLTPT